MPNDLDAIASIPHVCARGNREVSFSHDPVTQRHFDRASIQRVSDLQTMQGVSARATIHG
jgi:hypothetical protein